MMGTVPDSSSKNWLRLSCPLAFLNHQKGKDEKPSCGILVNEEGQSNVHCFCCGSRSLWSLVNVLFHQKKIDGEVVKFFLLNEGNEEADNSHKFKDTLYTERQNSVPTPQEILDRLIKKSTKFLRKRGINQKVHFINYNNLYGIVYPLSSLNGTIYSLQYRSTQNPDIRFYLKPKHFDYQGEEWGSKGLWYGLDEIDRTKPIFLVEGAEDRLKLKELGEDNVLASCGSVGNDKIETVRRLNPSLVFLGFDSDEAGKVSTKKIQKALKYTAKVLNWDVVGVNDPGDLISKDQIEKVLKTRHFEFKERL